MVKKKEGMKKKARLMGLLLAAVLFLPGLTVRAEASTAKVPVQWDNAASTTMSDDSFLIDGVTYVPFRAFCTLANNCEVLWDASTRTAYATTAAGATISAGVGDEYLVFGERCFFTAAPIRIVNDRLYVPIRPLAKCFGVDVTWNASSRSVTLRHTGQTVRHDAGVYDADALYWLSHIIGAESKGEPFRGQLAVGNVILNRVDDQNYPNTIYQVIFDRTYGVQFSPTANGTIYNTPPTEAVLAAKACLEGYTLSEKILYFFNPSIAQSHWISSNCTYAFRIGRHVFYI